MTAIPAGDLVKVAKKLVPEIVANRERIETERQLPPELASVMADQGLFSMYVPGGAGRT